MELTLVTCWYTLKSKFNKETYKIWIQNLMRHIDRVHVVLFTNRESYDWLLSFLPVKVKVVIKEFEAFYTWDKPWILNHKNNHVLNGSIHLSVDWRLIMLWNEKIHFVQEAQTYFNTPWIGWCDIGYFRHDKTPLTWPTLPELNPSKVFYGVPTNHLLNYVKLMLDKNEHGMPRRPVPHHQASIAGGFFIVHKDRLDWWHTLYYQRLNEYFEHKHLIQDDQVIILDCIANHFQDFCLLKETDPAKDKWFPFQSFLS